jgi:hypothetical protein
MSAQHEIADADVPSAVKRIAIAIVDRFEIPAAQALKAATALAADDQQWAFKIKTGYWLDPVREAIAEAAR